VTSNEHCFWPILCTLAFLLCNNLVLVPWSGRAECLTMQHKPFVLYSVKRSGDLIVCFVSLLASIFWLTRRLRMLLSALAQTLRSISQLVKDTSLCHIFLFGQQQSACITFNLRCYGSWQIHSFSGICCASVGAGPVTLLQNHAVWVPGLPGAVANLVGTGGM
jgi:hypothetical protein